MMEDSWIDMLYRLTSSATELGDVNGGTYAEATVRVPTVPEIVDTHDTWIA
jgi:hypothetical protein